MEILKWNRDREINPNDLRRVGDLSYFEGPLIVLYQHISNNYLYFVDWVDRDEHVNRWLVYRVVPRELLKYINRQISLPSLLSKTGSNQFFAVDVRSGSNLAESKIFNISEVPKGYLPDSDVFFDREDCTQYDLIKKIVLDALGNSKQENHFEVNSDSPQYSNTLKTDLHYALNTLSSISHKLTRPKLHRINILQNFVISFRDKLVQQSPNIIIITNFPKNFEENSLTEITGNTLKKVSK